MHARRFWENLRVGLLVCVAEHNPGADVEWRTFTPLFSNMKPRIAICGKAGVAFGCPAGHGACKRSI